jgi:hypothetical protein
VNWTEDYAAKCEVCQQDCRWIDCPTGGWWAHNQHPMHIDHDAEIPWQPLQDMDDQGMWFTCEPIDTWIWQQWCKFDRLYWEYMRITVDINSISGGAWTYTPTPLAQAFLKGLIGQ